MPVAARTLGKPPKNAQPPLEATRAAVEIEGCTTISPGRISPCARNLRAVARVRAVADVLVMVVRGTQADFIG